MSGRPEIEFLYNVAKSKRVALSVDEFAKKIGISRASFYRYKNGEPVPDDILDEASKLVAEIGDDLLEDDDLSDSIYLPTSGNRHLIPFFDGGFVTGDNEMYNNEGVKADYYMDIPEFSGCTAFRAYGDSMEEIIHSGDIVFANRIENWQLHLEYGQIYSIICTDNRRYLKYIRKSETETTHFLLRSENKEYDDFLIPKSEIKHIWLIRGWMNKRT